MNAIRDLKTFDFLLCISCWYMTNKSDHICTQFKTDIFVTAFMMVNKDVCIKQRWAIN